MPGATKTADPDYERISITIPPDLLEFVEKMRYLGREKVATRSRVITEIILAAQKNDAEAGERRAQCA